MLSHVPRHRSFGWLSACALCACVSVPVSAQSNVSPEAVQRIDSTLRAAVASGFSGTVLIASRGTVLLESGYGSIRDAPVSVHTRFWIASTAKQFVSAAILKCQERGLLNLNDSLGRFFPDAPSDKRHITIRQLLSHTSGLGQSYVSEGQPDRAHAVRAMLAEPVDQLPDRAFRYSNSNIQLAVAIVELVAHEAYQGFAQRELWSPIGMASTGFAGDPGASLVAPAIGETPRRLSEGSWGGEGVYSTASDLFRWYSALRSGRVLSHGSTELLFARVAAISEGHTGLAWFSGQSPTGHLRVFTRGNEDFGPNSLIYAYPQREVVIVVLTHAGNADPQRSWSRVVHSQIELLLSL